MTPRYDLRRLRLFVAVAEAKGVGRAARLLGMAQPPLSVQMRALEAEIGVALFDRSARGMALTAAGAAFLLRAKEALTVAQEAAETARAVAAGRGGRLSVGIMLVLAGGILPRLMPALRASMPGVALDIVEMTAATRETALLGREVAIALCMPAVHHPSVALESLAQVPLCLAMPAGDPLATLRSVPMQALRGRPLIGVPRLRPDAAASAVARAFLRRYGLAGQFRQSVETVVAAMALVAAGEGLAVVPAAAAAVRPRGVVLRRFTDATDQVEIAACWQRDDPPILLEPFLVAARLAVAEAVATGWR